jgi:hypothetical protein
MGSCPLSSPVHVIAMLATVSEALMTEVPLDHDTGVSGMANPVAVEQFAVRRKMFSFLLLGMIMEDDDGF